MVLRNDPRIVAIAMSLKLSREMLPYADEMARLYREGKGYDEIAETFFPDHSYPKMIYSAIRKLFHGHSGGMGVEAFEGIIPKDELKQLERSHKALNGNRMYSEKRGIHSLGYEERSKSGMIGGKKSGRKSVEERTGIHALTRGERAENSRKLHQSRGIVLWTEEELSATNAYAQNPEYRRDFTSLASRINLEYHEGREVRDAVTLKSALARYRRSQKSR